MPATRPYTRSEDRGAGRYVTIIVTSSRRRPYLPTLAVVAATGALAVVGWHELGGWAGTSRAVSQFRGEVIGPIVLGFLAVVLAAERLVPAVRRPFTSRGRCTTSCTWVCTRWRSCP